ncbi:MAG: hydroxyisourate hydrolase [Proteobacteria bacterium]|nr:hydroxyisourate hydrolase [Pseudomonadota bacterium]
MPIISSHILDSVKGCDAAGIRVRCQRFIPGAEPQAVAEVRAGDDGRIAIEIDTHNDEPGTRYEVVFFSGEYFAVGRQSDGVSGLINEVVVRLDLSDVSERCHVPMMIAPHNHSVWWSQ